MTKIEVAAHEFAFKNHSWLKNALPTIAALESFERGAKWRDANLWHDAQGDDLPLIDEEVIVLCDDGYGGYKVCFGHRPNKQGIDGISKLTKTPYHIEAKTYGKGGWNIPDVKWWLDCVLPNKEEKQ